MTNKLRFMLLLALALPLVSACVNLNKPAQSNRPAANQNAQAKAGAGGSAEASAPANPQRVFRGTIGGKYPIQMTLVRGDGDALTGSYFYERKGGDITLKGTIDRKGIFELRESDAGGTQTGGFKGQWHEHDYDPEATLEGDWAKADGKNGESFYLIEQAVAPVKITTQRISEDNKQRRYTVEAEYPQLEDASYAGFNAYARNLVTKAVNDYKKDAGIRPGEADAAPDAGEDSLDISYTTRLVTPELVSVEFEFDQYEHGAAHPGHSFEVANYDVRAGRVLKLADLFKPDAKYLPLLAQRATEKLKQWNKDSAQESGDGTPYLSAPEFQGGATPEADNYQLWTLTRKGLVVRYDYYQVGPYAAGAPVVQVPYAELKDALKPDGPVAPFTP